MTGFAAHNISHLSSSQITQYAADASMWLATRVLGYLDLVYPRHKLIVDLKTTTGET